MRGCKEKNRQFCSVRNLFSTAYVIAVFAILLIPVVSIKLKKNLHVDNRRANPFPTVNWENYRTFAPRFEAWFADRFGTRKRCVIVWNYLLVNLFGEPPSEQIVLGKDGFAFLASHYAGEEHRNALFNQLLLYDAEKVQQTADSLYAFRPYFRKERPQLLFVAVPTKHALNFDKLPDDLRRTFRNNPDGGPIYTEILEKLHRKDPEYADCHFLDLYPAAKAANREIQLIPIRNCHWVPGPYTHLAAHQIARKLHVIDDEWILDRENYVLRELDSDLSFAFAYDVTCPAWQLAELRWPVRRVPLDAKFPIPGTRAELRQMEFYAENPAAPGGKILVFGDSFCNPLCQDLARYFQQAVTMEYTAMMRFAGADGVYRHLREVVQRYDPDYIAVIGHGGFIFPDVAAKLVLQP